MFMNVVYVFDAIVFDAMQCDVMRIYEGQFR